MRLGIGIAITLIAASLPTAVSASASDEEYRHNLKLAQEKVERVNSIHSQNFSGAISSSILVSLMGRYYQVGDHWDVIALQTTSTQARKTSDPAELSASQGAIGAFHYEVIAVKTGRKPETQIRVTQIRRFGLTPVDPEISELTLTMNDQLAQSLKSYRLQNQSRTVPASPNGLHSSLTPLELFPLDVPDLLTARRSAPTELPKIPEALKQYARFASYSPQLDQTIHLEQDDFFGRIIDVYWQHGDPWPTYLRTANGVALLVPQAPGGQ